MAVYSKTRLFRTLLVVAIRGMAVVWWLGMTPGSARLTVSFVNLP